MLSFDLGQPIQSFKKLFTCPRSKELSQYRCESCDIMNYNLIQTTFYNFNDNQCIVLKFIRDCKVIVKDFDENCVIIPGDESQTIFTVQAAIKHIPFNKNNVDEGGHYVCCRRTVQNKGWLMISDTFSEFYNVFDKTLEGVYLLFLQKKQYL